LNFKKNSQIKNLDESTIFRFVMDQDEVTEKS